MVDADLSNYFNMIPHSDLLKSVARRVVDRQVSRLIKLWLKAPIEERDGDGTWRMSGGKGSTCGCLGAEFARPLLANDYQRTFGNGRTIGQWSPALLLDYCARAPAILFPPVTTGSSLRWSLTITMT